MEDEVPDNSKVCECASPADDLDAKGFYTDSTVPTANNPTGRNDLYYNMNHKDRGLALVFNHEYFEKHLELGVRKGTNKDCDILIETLELMGFKVDIYKDYDRQEVLERLEKVSKVDHTDHDCILVCVLSHGDKGEIYARDKSYESDKVWENFTAEKCPTLAGKPKLFFIQACQGQKMDSGVKMATTQTDSYRSDDSIYKIPVYADFLITYSAAPGFVSFRNENGTWFIQSLCKALQDYNEKTDILTLLTFMNREIAIEKESQNHQNITKHQKKQIACITSMLTRLLVFGKKVINKIPPIE